MDERNETNEAQEHALNDEETRHDATPTPEPEPELKSEPEPGPEPAEEIEALRRERDELNNRVLRLLADYQNLGRRAEQNVVVARDQQAMEMARALVGVLDNFDRALEVDPEKVASSDLLHGVSMVRDEMLRVLAKFDIERVDVKPGEPFDPNRHEAMMRQPAPDGVESGHVTQQFQPGYMLKDKTIRPAKVGVAE